MGILLALMIISVLFYFLFKVNLFRYQLSALLIHWLEICSSISKNITSNLENNLQTPKPSPYTLQPPSLPTQQQPPSQTLSRNSL